MTAVALQPDLEAIATLDLFDKAWYLKKYSDVRSARLNPLEHWTSFGLREGRDPNAYFYTSWYLQTNPDVLAAGLNPLLHYGLYGDQEGRRPMPYFDPVWYRRAYKLQEGELALRHFLRHRHGGSHLPCPELYVLQQRNSGRAEDPFVATLERLRGSHKVLRPDRDAILISKLLDINFYLINGTDVYDAELDPIDHFCRYGWREERRPNIYFDTRFYLETNSVVRRLQINPLTHYLLEGETAGRRPIVYFDPTWYRFAYQLEDGESALSHFITHRLSQRFSPTPLFDVMWYVATYRERIGPNRDPFAHYLQMGTLEDINPSPNFDSRAYRAKYMGRPSRAFRHLMHPDIHNPLVHYLLRTYDTT